MGLLRSCLAFFVFGIKKAINGVRMKRKKNVTKLKIEIVKRGINQRELAKKIGIHETLLSLIANGHFNANSSQKAKIARALKTPVAEVFSD